MHEGSIKRAHADLCRKMTVWLAETTYTAIGSVEKNLLFGVQSGVRLIEGDVWDDDQNIGKYVVMAVRI